MNILDRFIKYVKIDTESCHDATMQPSTQKQFDLANVLVEELKELGLEDIKLTDKCIVYAKLKANYDTTETIGFNAHIDTAPGTPGKNVKPNVITNYNGEDITLENGVVIKTSIFPRLLEQKGKTLVTTDGNTLLGADDKAGVAIIMDMLQTLVNNKDIKHKNIVVSFTPDEEIGAGTDNFDVNEFKCDFAYTFDGGKIDQLNYESFNGASCHVSITGVEIHPGDSKDKMVNASLLGMEFNSLLPVEQRPEYTSGYEGFNFLVSVESNCGHASLKYMLRNHSYELLEKQKQDFINAYNFIKTKYKKAVVEMNIEDSYQNMGDIIKDNPKCLDLAKAAMVKAGVTPKVVPIRGGTDGCRLTYMGIMCPNLPTGGYNFHGNLEYACLEEMETAVQIALNIIKNEE